jgi:uncharacterized heparinase superfamily protein
MFIKALLLFNTVKFLKFGQIVNRLKRKFYKPRKILIDTPKVSIVVNNLKPIIESQQKIFENGVLRFLNKELSFQLIKDWNSSTQTKLWLYNLHYFDDLNSKGSEQRRSLHSKLIQKWIKDNPYGYGNGWEPYPISLRIVNWIKWSLLGGDLKSDWKDSLASQARYLVQSLEYHLLGNHILANAKALVFAGLYFQGNEAHDWYQTGIKIIEKELSEQVLSDGGNFELSPMYHSILLEDLLDLINIHMTYNRNYPDNIVPNVILMVNWLKDMCHPDGEISFFNDSTLGIAPSLSELLNYCINLDIVLANNRRNGLTYHKESGYIRVDGNKVVLISDVAKIGPNYIPGHGHADTLSFELSLFGERVIVNSGISTYAINSERQKQRGTLAHSTISINDKNSSEVWGGFRVAKRAKVFNIKINESSSDIKFSACHDGYKRFKGRCIHFREWNLSGTCLKIVDEIKGSGSHKIISVFPLHPNILVGEVHYNSVELEINGKKVMLEFEGSGTLQVAESKYHPEFGLSIANKQLIYNYNGNLPYVAVMKVLW